MREVAAQAAPFGGVKESGYGREGSHWGLDECLQTKYLCQFLASAATTGCPNEPTPW